MVSRLWLREASLRSNFVTPLPTGRGKFLWAHTLPPPTPRPFISLALPQSHTSTT